MSAAQPDLLDLLHAVARNPHPTRTAEQLRIEDAIRTDAAHHFGEISPNRVRAMLTNATTRRLDVNPRVLSAQYSALRAEGKIVRDGWIESDDTRGGNAGKRISRYRWVAR